MFSQYSQSFILPILLLPFFYFRLASAHVTVYGYGGAISTSTNTGEQPQYTGMQAYNPVVLQPPPLPVPLPANAFTIAVPNAAPNGVSIKLPGSFMGFSIEFSVLNQVLGSNSTVLQVPFLNLMANIKRRVGSVYIRVGGNTQETATLVQSLPNGQMMYKNTEDTNNPTKTPPIEFTEDLIYMMANISALVNIQWFMGIPFNDTSNFRLGIAERGQAILGKYLAGLQVGNEPDLYAKHLRRPATYSPTDYGNEFGMLVDAVKADPDITNPNMLIAPNLAGTWQPDDVWSTGFAEKYKDSLGALAVERYPTDNCFSRYGYGIYHDAQERFATYMTHTSGQHIVSEYLTSQALAQQLNKPLMMFETNSASCGGFPGIADAFGASLWALDYALQMAYSNFSVAMFHIGGQNVSYNPFLPPPTAETFYHQWSVGPVYYAALAMAETLGPTNTAQVIDLLPNNGNEFTPAYAIYENGKMARMALFNYMTDPSGANDYTATISIGGGALGEQNGTPAQVQVKYLYAESVAQKDNITWGGQTFGGYFASDGRPQGEEELETVTCDTNANACQINVPAPGFALVFFSEPTLSESDGTQHTFATTVQTRTVNTATFALDALATSNGHRGSADLMGSTSPERNTALRVSLPSVFALVGLVYGGLMLCRML